MPLATTEADIQKKLHQAGVCVVVPTYNNAATLADVLSEVRRYAADVIVVDDGSTDATASILAAADDLTVVRHARNRGKGRALQTGLRKALELGFAYAITLDSDGQHYPASIPAFVAEIEAHPGALIVGARRLEGVERSAGSAFANAFSNFWFAVQTGRRLPDTQTGYRLYPLHRLRFLSLLPARYEAELLLLVGAAWHGVEIRSIPIDVYYPPRNERVSHFRPGPDFARISVLNTILCVLAIVYALPLAIFRRTVQLLRTLYALLFYVSCSWLVLTPAAWFLASERRATEERRLRFHRLVRSIARFVMLYHGVPGTTFSMSAPRDIDLRRPRLIISNHQSHLDLMCQLLFSPKIVFLTNDWVYNSPFFGYIVRRAEYLPVSQGIDAILPQLRALVARGYSIAVFPEGTRSLDARVGRFHQGAFMLADALGLDVLPTTICGASSVLPKHARMLRPGHIHIEIGEPVGAEERAALGSHRAQASAFRRKIAARCLELSRDAECRRFAADNPAAPHIQNA